MSRPTIGIMAIYMQSGRFEEMDYFRKLCVQGRQLDVIVMAFSPEDVDHDRKKIRGHFYSIERKGWYRKWSPFPDAIYDRCRNQTTSKFYQLKQFRIRYPQLNYLNRPLANKWGMYRILAQNEAIRRHLPHTSKFNNYSQLFDLLRTKKTLFLKPSNGTGGRGIIRVRYAGNQLIRIEGRDSRRKIIPSQLLTLQQLRKRLSGWPLEKRYLIQQGINLSVGEGRVHDYRLLIQKNSEGQWEITGCAGRIGPKSSITSNLHGGGSAVTMDRLLQRKFSSKEKCLEIKEAIYQLGYKISIFLEKKFGKLCELGLDIAVDPRGGVWLLEINPKPSREVFRRLGQHEIYKTAVRRPLQYAIWLCRAKKKKSAVNEEGSPLTTPSP